MNIVIIITVFQRIYLYIKFTTIHFSLQIKYIKCDREHLTEQLYLQQTKVIKNLRNSNTQIMDNHNDSKVQFFNSESSFGSHSAVSVSKLQFFNDQIISDTEAIISTLNQLLLPREDLLQKQKLDQLIHRARILSNQTINEHKNLFPSTLNASEHRQALHKCDVKLKQLIHDYESYHKKSNEYRYFYQKYTNNKRNFNKKQSSNTVFVSYQPDVIIIDNSSKNGQKKLKASNRIQNPQEQALNSKKDKQFQQLSQQLLEVRKRQSILIKNQQKQMQSLQKQADQRVKNILALVNNNISQSEKMSLIRSQIQHIQKQLEYQRQKNKSSNEKLKQLTEESELLRHQNQRLEFEIQNARRLAQSRNDQDQDFQRSVHSQFDTTDNVKKLQKKVKNLKYENEVLKNQLKKQREQIYKLKKRHQMQQQNQILNLRKKLQQKTNELKENKMQSDRNQLQIIRLTDQLQKSLKSAELIKLESTKTHDNFYPGNGLSHSRGDMNRLEQSRNNMKYSVNNYVGDGNQNYPYFQLLSKQFKIRLKRSCLKQKQLLYKLNMLEVGIISQFHQPNQIKLLLHLSNFSDQQHIKNLSIKVSNSKNNKTVLDKNAYQILQMQQQVKTFVNVFVKAYPIGCTALIIEYQYMGAAQQARIVLPAHIYKMLTIKPRDDEFRSPKKLEIQAEKKIVKDPETLFSYFKEAQHQNNKIMSTIFHQHTMTKFLLDIQYRNGYLLMQYEHRMGDENITEYAVKTIGFLLRKQQKN